MIPPEFLQPARVVNGWGVRAQLGELIAEQWRRALVVTGSRSFLGGTHWASLQKNLRTAGVACVHLINIVGEPAVADVDRAVSAACALHLDACDVILAIGGGAAIDLAKAVAALATQAVEGSVREFLEGVGTGRKLIQPPMPVIALPTTAGTGAEATRNAVLTVDNPPCKKSLRHDLLMPRVAVIDPELALTCPLQQSSWSGMDAFTQLIEASVSGRSNAAVRQLAGLELPSVPGSLLRLTSDSHDRPAREQLSRAAFLSGVCLTNSGLGLAHGVAAALGGMYAIPHGLACAVMLPISIEWNLADDFARDRYRDIAASCFGATSPEVLPELVRELNAQLGIPARLRELEVPNNQFAELAVASQGNSLNGNPRVIHPHELASLLEAHW